MSLCASMPAMSCYLALQQRRDSVGITVRGSKFIKMGQRCQRPQAGGCCLSEGAHCALGEKKAILDLMAKVTAVTTVFPDP